MRGRLGTRSFLVCATLTAALAVACRCKNKEAPTLTDVSTGKYYVGDFSGRRHCEMFRLLITARARPRVEMFW